MVPLQPMAGRVGGWHAAVFAVPFLLLSVVFALPGGY